MADYVIDGAILTNIADTIREKTGEADSITPEDMSGKVTECYDKGYETGVREQQTVIDSILDETISGEFTSNAKAIGRYKFYAVDITKATFPNATSMGTYAMYGCRSLVTVDMPKLTSIGSYGLQSCSKLQNVNMPELKAVPLAGFYNASALKYIDLPKVTNIQGSGFINCSALEALVLRSTTMCTLGSTNAFNGSAIADGTGFVYVPDELVEDYKAATNWSTFADQIKPISELEVA